MFALAAPVLVACVSPNRINDQCATKVVQAFVSNYVVTGAFDCLSPELQFVSTIHHRGGDISMMNSENYKFSSCGAMQELNPKYYYEAYLVKDVGLIIVYVNTDSKVVGWNTYYTPTCDKVPFIMEATKGWVNG